MENLINSLRVLWRNSPPDAKPRLLAQLQTLTGSQRTAIVPTMVPTRRQAEFLALDCKEAMFGGSAGGAKTEALLLWLAEGVHLPDYTGLIFRRTYPQLSRSNEGLIAKGRRMYCPMGAKWNQGLHQFTFPSGAIIEMGHLLHEKTVEDYQGPSYHRICFDELSQFTETQYTYLFSRIRRIVGYPITLGMRAATNPGGEGHVWVKRRFVTQEAIDAMLALDTDAPCRPDMIYWPTPTRAFVPSRLADNPFIDRHDYEDKLSELPPVTRARLLAGDWRISEQGLIRADWLRYWTFQGTYYRILRLDDSVAEVIDPKNCLRFAIADCASTSDDVAKEKRGKPPSHSVISVFDWHAKSGRLILLDVRRGRWSFPELCQQLQDAHTFHRPAWIGIEAEKTGQALIQMMRHLPTRGISHEGKDKVARFARASNEMAQGKIFFHREAAYRETLESELLSWTGHPDEPFDIGDTIGYAGLHCDRSGRPLTMETNKVFSGGWR
jgi:predicted phage terminase large subunit-like protein